MRLTLRMLLAYMDGNLKAKDAQDIGKKIQKSDFAKGLLQRIQDVTQRLRTAGTDAGERGTSMDPNTIAEYLDNVLPPDRVPDFEKVCLESDAHLAEVASCHQILTLVLGEPAEVTPESRLQMYDLPKQAATQPVATAEAEEVASGDGRAEPRDGQAVAARQGKEIPEYLREAPRGRQRAWLAALLVLVVGLGVVALSMTGQFRPGTQLGDLLPWQVADRGPVIPGLAPSGESVASDAAAEAGINEQAGILPGPATLPAAPPIVATPPKVATDEPETVADTSTDKPEIRQPVHAAPPQPVTPGPRAPLPADSAESAAMPSVPPTSQPVAKPAASPSTEPETQPPKTTPSAVVLPAVSTPAEPAPASDQPGAAAQPGAATQPGAGTLPVAPPMATRPMAKPMTVPREPVGEYVSTTEVLVRLDPASHWQRVPSQAALSAGDEIVSFPTYRPSFNLSGGASVQLLDGTRIVLMKPDAEGVAGLDVRYGRLIVKAGQAKDARLRLQFGPRTAVLRFADTESMIMIEVGRPLLPGIDPETQPSPHIVGVYVTSGAITLQRDANDDPLSVSAPMKFRLNDNPPEPVAVQELPGWSSPDAVSLLDQRASATVEPSLATDRRIELALRELTGHRQKEVRWLAMRCLGHLGDFEPMVRGLDDPEQKLVWQDYIDQLRGALGRGPQAAAEIRGGMERLFGDNGTILYELLWKHKKPELTKNDSTRLVSLLEHNVLAVRVLSFWNLREATGLSLYYRPEYPSAKRVPSVQKWRERMEVPLILPSSAVAGGTDSGEDSPPPPPALSEEDQE